MVHKVNDARPQRVTGIAFAWELPSGTSNADQPITSRRGLLQWTGEDGSRIIRWSWASDVAISSSQAVGDQCPLPRGGRGINHQWGPHPLFL
jgi:hypothetical protein